ncbi:MAG: HIT domain-containing protein [Mariprofundaceae bacterium]|nr:HIT domain-containing protein [Mariprofundaceae bacterium]
MILHAQLQQDCIILGRFELCVLLLLNDAHYPWFILVPQRENIREIHELTAEQQQQFIQESSMLSQSIENIFKADKMNIAALGNMVPQLHIHHIARFTTDPAWPKPVWGLLPAKTYTTVQIEHIRQKMYAALPQLHIHQG